MPPSSGDQDPLGQRPQIPSSSSYLSYPVSQVVSGLYRRFTDNSPNLTSLSAKRGPSQNTLSPGAGTGSSNNGVYTPPNRNLSPFQPPPLTPLTLIRSYKAGDDDDEDDDYAKNGLNEEDDDTILTEAIAEEIRLLVPPRLQLAESWKLVYTLERDGVSLGTLYNKCTDPSLARTDAFILVVQDGVGGTFGAYLTDAPSPHHSGYYGHGECFLWRASLVPQTSTSQLLANLPPPPSAPDSQTRDMGRSTTIAATSPTSPRRTSFSSSTSTSVAERRRRRSSAVGATKSPPSSPSHTRKSSGHARSRHEEQSEVSLIDLAPSEPSLPSDSILRPTNTPLSNNHDQDLASLQIHPPAQKLPPLSENTHGHSNHKPPPAPLSQLSLGPSNPPTPHLLRFKAFPYSGLNDYLILCESSFLSVGGGDGRYGLWLDDNLERGLSGPCPTFGNEGLSEEGNENGEPSAEPGSRGQGGSGKGRPAGGGFEVVGVEVWAVGV